MGPSLGVCAVLAIVFYKVFAILYRLYFHPLRKFPGPRIAASSRWYEFCFDVLTRGLYATEVDKWHERYGPIVRVTPEEVVEKDSSLAQAVGSPHGTFGTTSHVLHKHRRVPVAAFFAKRVVASHMQTTIWEGAEELCEVLRKAYDNKNEVIEGHVTFLAWAIDSLAACSFGENFGLLKDKKLALSFVGVFKTFALLYPLLKQFSWIIPTATKLPAAPFRLIYPPVATLLDVHVNMRKFAFSVWQQENLNKDKPKSSPASVFQQILNSAIPDDEKSPQRISHEGLEVLLAGSYTTARVVNLVSYYVLADPQLHAALQKELRDSIPDQFARVDLKVLEELPLLSAVIKEALRIGNITNHRLTLIATNEVLQYKQWMLPPGTRVSITPSANGLDPSVFPQPYVFAPSRWLDTDEATLKAMKRVFLPFAAGPRGCLGMHFASAEFHVAIASIFRRFKLELYDTQRARDIDHNWSHLISEPAHGSKGLRFRVVGLVDS
nr:trichodiene oxygenase [Quercus suber]